MLRFAAVTLALCAAAAAQEQPAPAQQVPAQQVLAPQPVPDPQPQQPAGDIRLHTGGVEAPAQPSSRSRAGYERTPRFTPSPARGAAGQPIRTSIETLVDVRGQEDNLVTGVGIVTGLAGTGDSSIMTRQLLANVLLANDIRIDPQQLTPKNCAIVSIEASLPAGIQPGRKIDCRVSTMGDAKSLQGGVLLFAELRDTLGGVWATAGGPVDVGGFLAEGAAGTVAKNHVTVGTISGGGKVERAVPSDVVSDHGFIYLDLRASQASFTNLVRIVEQIDAIYPGAAEAATDGRTVKVRVPGDLPRAAHVAYLDSILRLEVEPVMQPYVVVNERTGAIVIGEGVRLRPGAVALGGLTVSIAETPETSQPGPLSNGTTQTNPRTDLGVTEQDDALVEVPGAVTLHEVVEVLNVLGTTPRDLIQILEAMHQAGLLLAEVRRM